MSQDNPIPSSRKIRLRRNFFWVMLISLGVLILLGLNNHRSAAEDPEFCLNCHEMQASYTAWEAASHSKAACIDCHKDVSIAGYLYKQKIGVNRVSELKVVVDDSACGACHADARVITPPMDLLVPHNLHVEIGITCTQCHQNVIHGTTLKDTSPTAQTVSAPMQQGENQLDPNRIPMSACMKCHNGAKATSSCSACHVDKDPPNSHKVADFKSSHGFSALDNVGACNNCHQYDPIIQVKNFPVEKGWSGVQSFARSTDFCSDCHRGRPQGHQKLFTVNHGPAAKQDPNRCLTCHNQDEKGKVPQKAAVAVTCVQCHYNQHPAGFTKLHPLQIDKNNQSKCFTCHDANSCNDCHNKTFRLSKAR